MSKRRFLVFCLGLGLSILLSGCEDTAPKGAAALLGYDLTEGKHQITLSIVSVKEEKGEASISLLSTTGASASDALSLLQRRYGDRFIWGGLQCILIGREAAVSDGISLLAELEKVGEISPKTPVVVTDQSAMETMGAAEDPLDPSIILGALQNGMEHQITVESSIFSIMKGFREPLKNGLVSVLQISEDGEIYAEGCGIFLDGKLIALLDRRVTVAVNWLKGEKGEYPLQILGSRLGEFSGLMKNAHTTISPVETAQGIGFVVEVRLEASLESQSKGEISAASEIEEELEKEVQQAVTEALERTVVTYHSDLFGLQKRLENYCSFRRIPLPSASIDQLPFEINVKVAIGSWR